MSESELSDHSGPKVGTALSDATIVTTHRVD